MSADDIWGRLFVLIGLACCGWGAVADNAMWIVGIIIACVGLVTIPGRKDRDNVEG